MCVYIYMCMYVYMRILYNKHMRSNHGGANRGSGNSAS